MFRIGRWEVHEPAVLAPMAGVTDRPFRMLARRFGAGLAASEMITSDQRLWNSRKSRQRMNHDGEPEPRVVQLAGAEPDALADAARRNVDLGAQIIDINMGCPAKKVCNRLCGSALLQDEPLVARLLEAHDWLVDRVHLRAVPTIDLRNYALVIIGPETGERGDFHAPDVAGLLLQYPLPVLGMGEGGAAFFELADLRIGWSNTWYSSNNEIFAVAPSARYWQLPYAIDLGATAPLVKLYPGPLTELGVYVPEPGGSLELIAREVKDQHHYPVIRENRRERSFLLWGYNAGPSAMTKSGQALFVNVAQSLR